MNHLYLLTNQVFTHHCKTFAAKQVVVVVTESAFRSKSTEIFTGPSSFHLCNNKSFKKSFKDKYCCLIQVKMCWKCLKEEFLPTKCQVVEFFIVVFISIVVRKVLVPKLSPNVNEKYILEKHLGQGADGEVFLSETPEEITFAKVNPFVAIKVRNFTIFSQMVVFTHRKLNNRYVLSTLALTEFLLNSDMYMFQQHCEILG